MDKSERRNMPKKMEMALMKEAKKKGMSKKRMGAYVYGTMRKTGWTPKGQKKSNSFKKKSYGS